MNAASRRRATVDRIEEDDAGNELATLVFDDGQELIVRREALPAGARESSVLRVNFELDSEAEAERRAAIRKLQRKLFQRDS